MWTRYEVKRRWSIAPDSSLEHLPRQMEVYPPPRYKVQDNATWASIEIHTHEDDTPQPHLPEFTRLEILRVSLDVCLDQSNITQPRASSLASTLPTSVRVIHIDTMKYQFNWILIIHMVIESLLAEKARRLDKLHLLTLHVKDRLNQEENDYFDDLVRCCGGKGLELIWKTRVD